MWSHIKASNILIISVRFKCLAKQIKQLVVDLELIFSIMQAKEVY